jgi:hypothetical protein
MGSFSEGVYTSEVFPTRKTRIARQIGVITEPAREVPVIDEVDVIVVGGGPAGTAAAIAAGRRGARVALAERYNHLGGLSTGGLVIWIDRMTDWSGRRVIAGIGQELLDRLPADAILGPADSEWGRTEQSLIDRWKPRLAAFHRTVTWSPMIDPEQLKAVSLAAVREAGVELYFHSVASMPINEDGRLAGVIFEGKQGRFAVAAKVVIDTTGDGDMFARAGEKSVDDIEASSIHQCINTAWLWGGVDIGQWLAFQNDDAALSAFTTEGRRQLGLFELPCTSWRDDVALFLGPRYAGFSALDVRDLTEVELLSRDKMMELLDYYRRHAPGFEKAWILLTAPQIGVRQGRRLIGRASMTRQDWRDGVVHGDEIGISPSLGPTFPNVSVPYRSLLPMAAKGLIVAGRHLSCDASSHTFMREIPQCWLTGQAAGTAAAIAISEGCELSDVHVPRLQDTLEAAGVVLRRADDEARQASPESVAHA